MLGYNAINIFLSKTTKIDDLRGKITIVNYIYNDAQVKTVETEIIKVLKSSSGNGKLIIVFHNINNASSNVLEALDEMFYEHHNVAIIAMRICTHCFAAIMAGPILYMGFRMMYQFQQAFKDDSNTKNRIIQGVTLAIDYLWFCFIGGIWTMNN